MSGIRILSGQEVMDILDMRSVIKADEQAFHTRAEARRRFIL